MEITDLCSTTKENNCVKTLQIVNKVISLVETPATKMYPARRPLVRLCFRMAKMTGPMEILKIIPSKRPFDIGSSILFS